jgi:hypothetical protein
MNAKILISVLTVVLVFVCGSTMANECYVAAPACMGSCLIGNCIPAVVSLPPVSSKKATDGWYESDTNCGVCWKGSDPVGVCGPKLATGEACL